jgi:hypothetical protein
MRGTVALTLVGAVAIAGSAAAQKIKAKAKPPSKRVKKVKATAADEVDVSTFRSELIVLETSGGHNLVIRPEWVDGKTGSSFSRTPSTDDDVFFGDDKTLNRLRLWTTAFEGKSAYRIWFWDPRAKGEIELAAGKWTLRCGDSETELTDVTARSSTKQLLEKASFKKPVWKRQEYALARDDTARYYFVDQSLERDAGFRIFIGPKGRLREIKMVDIARDSEGDIFATKQGSLRLVLSKGATVESSWVQGKDRTGLTYVPVDLNVGLIYGELGVYASEALGTPCDTY